jgi:hypothetical protein
MKTSNLTLKEADQLIFISGYKIKEAHHVTHHIYGWKHQNFAGRFSNNSQGIVQSVVRQNWS